MTIAAGKSENDEIKKVGRGTFFYIPKLLGVILLASSSNEASAIKSRSQRVTVLLGPLMYFSNSSTDLASSSAV